jgi:hypothetical protein
MRFNANQDFHEVVDALSLHLKELGLSESSEGLHTILHGTAWTTSSELLGEIKLALVEVKNDHRKILGPALLQDIESLIKSITDTWGRR